MPIIFNKKPTTTAKGTLPLTIPPPTTSVKTPTQKTIDVNSAKPFMAQKVSTMANFKPIEEGSEAWYGSGFQGWFRRAFASVLDPKFFLPNATTEQNAAIEQAAKQIAVSKPGELWDTYLSKITGVKAQDIGKSFVAISSNIMEGGDSPTKILPRLAGVATGIVSRNITQSFNNFLFPALQVGEVPIRQAAAGLQALGDVIYKDADFLNRFKLYSKGSEAIYSLIVDRARREEFIKRAEAGENPDFLAMQYQNPWAEAGFSIATDLTNLIPGKVLATKGGDLFSAGRNIIPEVGVALNAAGDAVKGADGLRLVDEAREAATKVFQEARGFKNVKVAFGKTVDLLADTSKAPILPGATKVAQRVSDASYFFSKLFSPNTAGKTEVVMRSIAGVFDNVVRMSKDKEAIAKIGNALVNLGSSDAVKAQDAFFEISRSPFAKQLLTPDGARTGAMLSELMGKGNQLIDEIVKFSGTPDELMIHLNKKMEAAAVKMFVGVDDLAKASKAVKAGSTKALDISRAAKYDALDWGTKAVANVHEFMQTNMKVAWLNKAFANIYMGWTPAYAARNWQNNALTIFTDAVQRTGLKRGAEVTGRAMRSGVQEFFSPGSRAPIVRERIKNLLGALPRSADMSAVESKLLGVKAGGPILKRSQSMENVMRNEVILGFVEDEIAKFLKNDMWLDEAVEGVNKFEKDLVASLMRSTDADIGKVRKALENTTVDVWRTIQPDDVSLNWMKKSNTWDALKELREKGLDPDDFYKQAHEIVDEADDFLYEQAAKEPLQLSPEVADKYASLYQDLMQGLMDYDAGKVLMTSTDFGRLATDETDRLRGIVYDDLLQKRNPNELAIIERARQAADLKLKIIGESDIRRAQAIVYDDLKEKLRTGNFESLDSFWKYAEETTGNFAKAYKDAGLKPLVRPTLDSAGLYEDTIRNWGYESVRLLWKSSHDARRAKNMAFMDSIFKDMPDMPKPNFDLIEDYIAKSDRSVKLYIQMKNGELYVLKQLTDINIPSDATLDLFKINGIHEQHLLNIANKARKEAGAEILSMDKLTKTELVEAVSKRAIDRVPILPSEDRVTLPRALSQSYDNTVKKRVDAWIDDVVENWGVTKQTTGNTNIENLLQTAEQRFADMRPKWLSGGEAAADFALHDYIKNNFDQASQYLMPYGYWYSRTYPKWAARIAKNPKIAIAYAKYRRFMEQQHAGMPDWYKYQLSTKDVGDLFGFNVKNPIYFNLEQTLNPINGLTGVDFNDANKRVGWFATMMDDLQKFGPSLFTPINWAVATTLVARNEEDAAKRWFGRLLPQTSQLKTTLSMLGVEPFKKLGFKYNELDPFVKIFSGGLDPYEERRAIRTLAGMVDRDEVTQEAADEAGFNKSGALWEQAVMKSLSDRGVPNLTSFIAGAGYKYRNASDMEIDRAYQKLNAIYSMRSSLSPDDFRSAMSQLSQESKFLDVLLISAKGGDERTSSYAYNVLSRLPPGKASDIFEAAGIRGDIVDEFYANKGVQGMNTADKKRFEAIIIDLGAMLKMPDGATRQAWDSAKRTYQVMKDEGENMFGKGIWDKVYAYYDANAQEQGPEYLQNNPDVQKVLDWQTEVIAATPILTSYYGSINTIDYYYAGKIRQELFNQFGDLQPIFDEWKMIGAVEGSKPAAKYYKAHPELKAYTAAKKELEASVNESVTNIAKNLPEALPATYRQENQAFDPNAQEFEQSQTRTDLQKIITPTKRDYLAELPDYLQRLVIQYLQGGELNRDAMSALDFEAERLGLYDANDLLQQIGSQ